MNVKICFVNKNLEGANSLIPLTFQILLARAKNPQIQLMIERSQIEDE